MSNQFSSAKHTIAECDICGFRYKLLELKPLIVKTKVTNTLACPECWSPDHPQLQVGMYPVVDPQAVKNPRPDLSRYSTSGSRNINWGWNPVGGGDGILTPNPLIATGSVGTVTVESD